MKWHIGCKDTKKYTEHTEFSRLFFFSALFLCNYQFLLHADTQHCEVVVGFCPVAERLHLLLNHLYGMTCILELRMTEEVEQAIVTKLFLSLVLCLVETVRIEEQRMALYAVDALALILQTRPQADRRIRQDVDELSLRQDHRRVMAGVTEVEMTSLQIHES